MLSAHRDQVCKGLQASEGLFAASIGTSEKHSNIPDHITSAQ